MIHLDSVIDEVKPDIILVHGDTTTTFAASVSAFYHQVPLGHVEAGLRTWDKYSPYPEEMNRQLTDILSDYYFAPTSLSRENLLKQNHPMTVSLLQVTRRLMRSSKRLMKTITTPYWTRLTISTVLFC